MTLEEKLKEIATGYVKAYIASIHTVQNVIAEEPLFYDHMFNFVRRGTVYEHTELYSYIREFCISDINFYVDQHGEVLKDKLKKDFKILV